MRANVAHTFLTRSPAWRRLEATALSLMSGLVALPVVSLATNPGGEIPDSVFTSGFEVQAPYVPPVLIESSAVPRPGRFLFTGEIMIPFMPGSHDPDEIRLLVDGTDVTEEAHVVPEGPEGPGMFRIRYEKSSPVEPRLYVVEARIGPAAFTWVANALEFDSWTFMPERNALLPPGSRSVIGLHFGELSGRFDLDSVRFFLDGPGYTGKDNIEEGSDEDALYGADLTPHARISESSIEYYPATDLEDGNYFYAQFEARDRFVPSTVYGISWSFNVGPRPRVLAHEPGAVLLPVGSSPALRVQVASEGYPLRSHVLSYDGYHVLSGMINRLPGVETEIDDLSDGTYIITHTPTHEFVPLQRYCYSFWAENELGFSNEDFLHRSCFHVDQDWGRKVEILSPQPDAVVASETVEVRVRATANRGGISGVRIGGKRSYLNAELSTTPQIYHYNFRQVELVAGENFIDIEVIFTGETGDEVEHRQLRIYYVPHVPAPEVEIDSASDWQSFGPINPGALSAPGGARDLTGNVQRPIRIEGRTSTVVQRVEINQQSAELSSDGRSFHFDAFLHEGSNLITATATDAEGRSGSASISVYVDQTAPLLTVESPTLDTVTSLRRIDVRGLVNDAVQAPVETGAPQVRVRNQANGTVREKATDDCTSLRLLR